MCENMTTTIFHSLLTAPAPVPVQQDPPQNHANHPPAHQGNAGNANGGHGHH